MPMVSQASSLMTSRSTGRLRAETSSGVDRRDDHRGASAAHFEVVVLLSQVNRNATPWSRDVPDERRDASLGLASGGE